jgi:hypothetical protein
MRVSGMGHPLPRRLAVAASIGLLAGATLGPATALATNYDNTNPLATPCGNGSHISSEYRLGNRTESDPWGSEALKTPIKNGTTVIGEVEIRHSAYCGTVWSKVWNLTATTVQAREALVTYTSVNGAGRNVRWYPGTDTLTPPGGTTPAGWSNQFYDSPSFSAIGCITVPGGVEKCAETARTISWAQRNNYYPDYPFSCTGSGNYLCERWRTAAVGVSATAYYHLDSTLSTMPCGSYLCDVRPSIRTTFEMFNAIPYPIPFLREAQSGYTITVQGRNLNSSAVAWTYRYLDSAGYIKGGLIELNTGHSTWGDSADNIGTICHETDHLLGLKHVRERSHISPYVEWIGSKATCIGEHLTSGPSLDDKRAFNALYSGVYP